MIEYIWTIIIIYLLYKLVFEFLLPVSKATSRVKNKIKEMQEQEQHQYQQQQATHKAPEQNTREADYIDFEEVKD